MWFRNLLVYRLTQWKRKSAAQLDEQFSRLALPECGKMDFASRGWVAPGTDETKFVLAQQGAFLIALGTEQKLLPPAVITQELQQSAKALAQKQGYAPGRKQLREMRERVVEDLLPRALVKRSRCCAVIDAEHGWLWVDAASVARGDEVIEALQKTIDGLALSRLKTQRSPLSAMTQWLAEGEVPGPFSIDRDAELRAPGAEKSSIRYVRHALDGDEVGEYLAAGKQVARLALTWQDRISFVLDEETQIKRLAFHDLLKEQAAAEGEDEAQRIEADFAIMRGELAKFLPDLVAILGGEA